MLIAIIHGGPGAHGSADDLAALIPGAAALCQRAMSVTGAVEELAAELEPGSILIGHSWGAWLAGLCAAAHPELAGKLALIGCGPLLESYVPLIAARRAANLGDERAARFERLLASGGDPAEISALAEASDAVAPLPGPECRFDQTQYNAIWPEAAALRHSGALLAAFREINCPTAIFHGADDPHPAAGVTEPLAGRTAEIRIFPRCGHTPWREKYAREDFLRAIAAFCELDNSAAGDIVV